MSASAAMLLVARREWRLLRRRRTVHGALLLLAAVAWLPPMLLPLRGGVMGLASFEETSALTLGLSAAILPLLALLAGADLLAGEIEDGTLVPVVTLPLSRSACFVGKYVGRTVLLGAAYSLATASVGGAIALGRGTVGWQDYAIIAVGGGLLCLACVGIGTAVGVSSRGRVRAFGGALAAWLLLVFVVDAVLLGAVVAFAPPAPEEIGVHGHSELGAQQPAMMPDAHCARAGAVAAEPARSGTGAAWLMSLDPVDLFRLTAFVGGPGLHARLAVALPAGADPAVWAPLLGGWLVWIGVPPLFAWRRFCHVVLR